MRERNAILTATAEARWLLLPLAVGIFLRCWGVPFQVVGGDEMHAVRAALWMPAAKALSTYRPSDHCMPISGSYRLLMDLGVEVSELHLRLPILASGFLALWLIPWWTARRIDRPPAVAVAWLLAFSPVLVHYGRLIRPYTPILLLGFGAVAAYESWLRTASRRSAALYVALGTLAAYFHLVSVPFVLSPFLYFAAAKLWRRGAVAPTWRAAFLLGLATVGAFLLFLIPAWSSLMQLIALKRLPSEVTWHTWSALLGLMSGTGFAPLVTLFWLLAVAGLVTLARKKPALAGYCAVLVAGQIVGILVLSPKTMHQGPIFNRYMIVTLPFVLIWAAVGMTLPWGWLAARPWSLLPRLATAVFLGVLVVSGPVLDREFRRSPFVLHPESLLFYSSRRAPPDIELPETYRSLDPQRAGRIVEYPWHTTWLYCRAIVHFQQLHGRRVIVAPGERLMWDERLSGWSNMVAPQRDRILATDAVYFFAHLESAAENAAFDQGRAPPGSPLERSREHRQRELERFDQQVAARIGIFEKHWGPADFESDGIKVWDLVRVRSLLGERPDSVVSQSYGEQVIRQGSWKLRAFKDL